MSPLSLDIPVDDRLGPVLAEATPTRVLEACRDQLVDVPSRQRAAWRYARVVESLYQPGEDLRLALAFTADPDVPPHRLWPAGDLVYLRAPIRERRSTRGRVLSITGHPMELYRFPRDRRLNGLRTFIRSGTGVAMWEDWLASSRPGARVDPDSLQRNLLRYVPEQKWVARLRADVATASQRTTQTERLVVRVMRPTPAEQLYERHRRMRKYATQVNNALRAPRVIGGEARRGILGLKWVGGQNLLELMQAGQSADLTDSLARALAQFHASAVARPAADGAGAVMAQLQEAVGDLAIADPSLAPALKELRADVEARADGMPYDEPVTLHNDLHVRQIRFDGSRFTFLDYERLAAGDPLRDVAALAAQFRLTAIRPDFAIDPATADRWATAWVAAWQRRTGRPIGEDRFRVFSAAALLLFARGMMRHLRPGWRTLARKSVEMAQATLADPIRTTVTL